MSTGARSTPPQLANFKYVSWLGGGGYADVFLYEQLRPARQVAIKVLRSTGLGASDLASFDAEANVMARVSTHPYIVAVFEADVAPDGRPYLVMEYYSEPHFGRRARGAGLAVHEVLKVGVRIASAVETAHRAGVLHRDIKPANILVNDYGRPGLTDFGIAGDRREGVLAEAHGYSVPYAPPEVLDDSRPGDERSDVYSLGATLYALLAGRAPFEAIGGDNSAQSVMQRTLREPVPPTGRADVPRNLELLIAQAMAKDPSHRPGTAAELGRALQGIERDLHLSVTDFELAGGIVTPPPMERDNDDADSTRAGRVQVVRPHEAPAEAATPPSSETAARGAGQGPGSPVGARLGSDPPADTVARRAADGHAHGTEASGDLPDPVGGRSVGRFVGAAAAVAVVGGIGVAVLGGGGGGDAQGEEGSTPTSAVVDQGAFITDVPDTPTNVEVVVADGVATISWDPGDAQDVDTYLVERTDPAGTSWEVIRVEEPSAVVEGIDADTVPCFAVTAVREVGQPTSGRSSSGCAESAPASG